MTRSKDNGGTVPLKPVEFLMLAVLHDDPLHGYGIVREIEQRTRGRMSLRPGDVYRVIYRLQQRGLLDKAERFRVGELEDERRTYYRITSLGRETVVAEAEMLADVSRRLLTRSPRRSESG